MKIGVLAFQGDFDRHIKVFNSLGQETVAVRTPEAISDLEALVLPGGESTTIGMLMTRFGLMDAVRRGVDDGLAIYGTCAGAILMSDDIEDSDQPRLGVIDTTIERNAYGRQVDSFEADISVPVLGSQTVRGVFIRAPRFNRIGDNVTVLASFEDVPVIVQQGRHIALTFHPELTSDTRIQEYFLDAVTR